MYIVTKAKDFEVTEALSLYVEKKLEAVKKYFHEEGDATAFADVELGKSSSHHHHAGDLFRAEVNLRYNGVTYRAVSEKDNLYSAIDDVKDELVRELDKSKKKKRHFLHKGGAKIKNMIRGIFGKNHGA
jgi:ribosomal subunit interface protein